MKIIVDNKEINFVVEYGKRKRIAIHIDTACFVKVKAPKDTPEEKIIEVVTKHAKWILKKTEALSNLPTPPGPKEYHSNEVFMYLGDEKNLTELIAIDGLSEDKIKQNLKKFYIDECKKIIHARIKIYQKPLKVKPKNIEIVESKTQWGSCSSEKNLTFNYRLAMAPLDVIDYVVVHELCHLVHMNHDRSFWRLVGSIVPDYKEKKEYLSRYSSHMTM